VYVGSGVTFADASGANCGYGGLGYAVVCGQLRLAGAGIGGTQFYLAPSGANDGQAIIDTGPTGSNAYLMLRYQNANRAQIGQFGTALFGVYESTNNDYGFQLNTSTGLVTLGEGNIVKLTRSGGMQIGSPTGGDKGTDTLNLAGSLYNNGTAPTGSGAFVLQTNPSLATPNIGAATATTIAGQKSLQATRTTNYAVQNSDSNTEFDNTGASGEVDFTLPAYAAGLRYCFTVTAAQTLKVIAPASSQIAIGTTNSATAGNITASAVYSSACIVATSVANQWAARSTTGLWTVN
jgi:hypothetical protein